MNSKRIGFRIGMAASSFVAIIAYFLPIFKIKYGAALGVAAKIFSGQSVKTQLSPFDLIIALFSKDNLDLNTRELLTAFRIDLDTFGIYIVLLMIFPLIIAIVNLALSFLPNEKACGATLAGTNALSLILTILSVILFSANVKAIIIETTKLGVAPYLAMVAYLAGLIVAVCFTFAVKKDVNKVVYYDEFGNEIGYDPNGYADPNGYYDQNGYYDMNGYYDPGYYDPGYYPPEGVYGQPYPVDPSVTVILDDHTRGFINTPANVVGSIKFTRGPYSGTSFPLKNSEELVIGRDPLQCHIVIDSNYKFVSKKHCALCYVDNKFKLTVYSSNGVFLNDDKKIPQGKKIVVSRGDTISIGNKDVVFEIR